MIGLDLSDEGGVPVSTCPACGSRSLSLSCHRCAREQAEIRLKIALQDLLATQRGTPAQRLAGVAASVATHLANLAGPLPAHRALTVGLVKALHGLAPEEVARQVRAAAEWIEARGLVREPSEVPAALERVSAGRAA
jgi:hypothetical protein